MSDLRIRPNPVHHGLRRRRHGLRGPAELLRLRGLRPAGPGGYRRTDVPGHQRGRHQKAEVCRRVHDQGRADDDQEEALRHQGALRGQGRQDQGGRPQDEVKAGGVLKYTHWKCISNSV